MIHNLMARMSLNPKQERPDYSLQSLMDDHGKNSKEKWLYFAPETPAILAKEAFEDAEVIVAFITEGGKPNGKLLKILLPEDALKIS
jgi:hypothetical protein